MVQTLINFKTAPGHQVLAAAGKQALRPGGYGATEQLLGWANLQPGETVLELAASFGHSAIALAQRYGVRVVGIEKNPDSVAQARANVEKVGLTDQVTIREGDIFHLDQVPETFDCVLAEAILTMQSAPGKAKILAGVRDRLQPGGRFLSHELLADGPNPEIIHKDLAAAIRVNAQPLSSDDWIAAYHRSGLNVQHHATGPMTLLNPQHIAQQEGLPTLITLGWNLLTRPVIRDRILTMRQVFRRHASHLGYIILCAQKLE
ncbi:class I SAM-dependent methyltransferase [Nodosilinea sp. LEGE 07298]|uniref:SAM-dependent methyltransferase n=1 Tax=Nodosilinea sp. LEGE 07298 TaxID=2777970 RepID=UPI00187FBE1D|nr:class I SAM-dependent methyltransferase [Nodosilinea sp. LEGE 07298]MBE9114037.1 class I SAM-dependent methyltransferase [Nodosilinea sp. LEGE 07298]